MSNPRLQVDIGANISELQSKLKSVENTLSSFGSKLTQVGTRLSASLTLPLIGVGGAAIKLASDFEESLNKVNVAFGNSASEVKNFANTTLSSFGIAEGSALDMAALFGDMATSMGINRSEAAKMSTQLVGLSGDLASFKNISIDRAQTALAGVFTGETEALKGLGIVMTQANLQAFAFSQGIQKNIQDMTQAEQVNLRFAYVMDKTANAQGDFARTQGGAANQMRIFQEGIKELGQDLGSMLLPAFTKVIKKVNNTVKAFSNFDEETKTRIINIGLAIAGIGPILVGVGLAFKTLAGIIAALTSPVTLVIVAIMGIAAAGLYVYKNWEALKERMGDPAWWKNLMISMMQIVVKYNAFSILFDGFIMIAELITQHMGGMINTLIKGFLKFQAKIKDVVGDMSETIGGLARHLPGMEAMGASIQAFGVLEKEGSKSLEELANSGTDFAEILNEKLQNVENPFHKLAEGLEDAKVKQQEYNTELQTAVEFFKSLGDDALKLLGISFLPKAETTETETPQEETTAQNAVNTALKEKKSILQQTLEIFPNLIEAMRSYVLQFADGLASIIVYGGKVSDMLKDIAKQLASKALSKFIEIALLGGATGGLGALFGGFLGKGGGLLGGILPKVFGASGAVSMGMATPQLSGANVTVGGQFVLKGTDLVGSITKTQNSILR